MDDKKADATENDKTNVSGVDNNSANNKTEKAGSSIWPFHILFRLTLSISIWFSNVFVCMPFVCAGNTKATTNSSKSNDDTDKNAKKSNDEDSAEAGKGTALGDIPKIEKYIANTRIDGLQTLYQVRISIDWLHIKRCIRWFTDEYSCPRRFASNRLAKQMWWRRICVHSKVSILMLVPATIKSDWNRHKSLNWPNWKGCAKVYSWTKRVQRTQLLREYANFLLHHTKLTHLLTMKKMKTMTRKKLKKVNNWIYLFLF